MHPLLKYVLLGVVVAAIAFPVLAYADEESALRGPQLFWIVPLVGVVLGLLQYVRRGASRRTLRAGAAAAGRDPDAAEAASEQSLGDLWRRSPALTIGVVVLLVVTVVLVVLLRMQG